MSIDRPVIVCDEHHNYTLDGEPVYGASTVAGALKESGGLVGWAYNLGRSGQDSPDAVRQRAADRGNAVHDALEALAQSDKVPNPRDFHPEVRPYVLGLLRWYDHHRPNFVATEVTVGSRTHRFAGRYDLRCVLTRNAPDGLGRLPLVMVDLKTSKSVYPTEHFPQLAAYEGASVEMGFEPTAGQFVLLTTADGGFEMVPSWARFDHFLRYLDAYRAKREIIELDPKRIAKREADENRRIVRECVESCLPATAGQVAEIMEIPTVEVSRHLQALKKLGRAGCEARVWRIA